ncbi:MAG: sulfatase-like hydrolase/transferase [Acidimicrobiia bacterium]
MRAILTVMVAVVTVTAGVFVPAASAQAGASSRPNILFVLTDDMALSDLSAMPHVRSLLAEQGTTFSNAFVSVSLCCPSRTTILRGQYSHNDGVETNGGGNGGFEAAHTKGVEDSTIATWLHSAGYRTGLFGKYLNGYPDGVTDTYVPPGWDDFVSPTRGGNPYRQLNYNLNDNGRIVHYGYGARDYGTDVYSHRTSEFVTRAAHDGKPFFAYLALYAPHVPATAAPRDASTFPGVKAPRSPSYNEADMRDKPTWLRSVPLMSAATKARVDELYRHRLQSLQAVDDSVAELMDTLQHNGQLRNTYILFTSDNGYHLGQHRMPAGKLTAYDEDIHVPLVVRGPGVPEGRTRDQIVGNVDFAPTFAELAGAKAPQFVDGRSLVPLLRSGSPPDHWRQAYLVEHWLQTRKDGQDIGRLLAPLEPIANDQRALDETTALEHPHPSGQKHARDPIPEFHAIRTAQYLYVEYSGGERELYDLKKDPYELDNIAGSAPAKLLAELHRRVTELQTCREESCRTAESRA